MITEMTNTELVAFYNKAILQKRMARKTRAPQLLIWSIGESIREARAELANRGIEVAA